MNFMLVYWFVIAAATFKAAREGFGTRFPNLTALAYSVFGALGTVLVVWMCVLVAQSNEHPGNRNWVVAGMLLWSVVGIALYGVQLWKRLKTGALKVGFPAIALASCVYLVFACANHYWFLRGDQNKISLLYADDVPWFAKASGCDQYVLVRIEKATAEYHCETDVMLGGASSRWPFIPWLDYKAGQSVRLKHFLEEYSGDPADLLKTDKGLVIQAVSPPPSTMRDAGH